MAQCTLRDLQACCGNTKLSPRRLLSSPQKGNFDEGEELTPSGLSLDEIYRQFKLEIWDLDEGFFGIDSRNPAYGIEIVKAQISPRPSLGVELVELARGADGRGLVLVSGLAPGGNAEQDGSIAVGDTLCFVGSEPSNMVRVEALDWDSQVGAISQFADKGQVMLVFKRLVKRQPVEVVFELPDGVRKSVSMLGGSNLRGEMIRYGVEVYDPKTKRYDQPYATGNCGGEGICGTCFVEVVEGREHLSPPGELERRLVKNFPTRWRLSCKTVIGPYNTPGQVALRAVPQSDWAEERRRRT
ncbi:unnamed protein product [Phaeothamnion confervicola]